MTATSQLWYQNTGYTVSCWVKSTPTGTQARIITLASTASNNQVWLLQQPTGTSKKLSLFIRNDANLDISPAGGATTTDVLNGFWNHVVITDSNGTCKVYINGVLDATSFNYTRSGAFTINRTGFGALVRATATNWYTGLLDDIRIWNNTVLTASDVTALYYQGTNPSTPTSWYKFDEGSGTTATDSGSLATNGSTTGTYPAYSTDVFMKPRTTAGTRTVVSATTGNALSFNGSTSHVLVTTVAAQNSLTNATISLWFNATAYNNAGGGTQPRLFQKGNNQTTGWLDVSVNSGSSTLIFSSLYSVTSMVRSVTAPSLSTWHHVLITTDGSGTAANTHIYVDGSELTYQTSTDSSGTHTVDGSVLSFGGRNADDLRDYQGLVDEIRLYNRILTAAEIAILAAKGDVQNGLVGWWPGDTINGTKTPDYSSSATDGTITSTTIAAGTVPLIRPTVQTARTAVT